MCCSVTRWTNPSRLRPLLCLVLLSSLLPVGGAVRAGTPEEDFQTYIAKRIGTEASRDPKPLRLGRYDSQRQGDGASSEMKDFIYAEQAILSAQRSPNGSYCAGVTLQLFAEAYFKAANPEKPKDLWLNDMPLEDAILFQRAWYAARDLIVPADGDSPARKQRIQELQKNFRKGSVNAILFAGDFRAGQAAIGKELPIDMSRPEDDIKKLKTGDFIHVWFDKTKTEGETGHSAIFVKAIPQKSGNQDVIAIWYWSSQPDNAPDIGQDLTAGSGMGYSFRYVLTQPEKVPPGTLGPQLVIPKGFIKEMYAVRVEKIAGAKPGVP